MHRLRNAQYQRCCIFLDTYESIPCCRKQRRKKPVLRSENSDLLCTHPSISEVPLNSRGHTGQSAKAEEQVLTTHLSHNPQNCGWVGLVFQIPVTLVCITELGRVFWHSCGRLGQIFTFLLPHNPSKCTHYQAFTACLCRSCSCWSDTRSSRTSDLPYAL